MFVVEKNTCHGGDRGFVWFFDHEQSNAMSNQFCQIFTRSNIAVVKTLLFNLHSSARNVHGLVLEVPRGAFFELVV